MKVSEAVTQRRSCRAFLDQPVDPVLLRDVLIKASRAASGGNVQPWQVYLLGGEKLVELKAQMADRLAAGQMEGFCHKVFPKSENTLPPDTVILRAPQIAENRLRHRW